MADQLTDSEKEIFAKVRALGEAEICQWSTSIGSAASSRSETCRAERRRRLQPGRPWVHVDERGRRGPGHLRAVPHRLEHRHILRRTPRVGDAVDQLLHKNARAVYRRG